MVMPAEVPALGCALMFTVAILVTSIHGAVPNSLYSNVLVIAPKAGVKVPNIGSNEPPLPVSCVQVPPGC